MRLDFNVLWVDDQPERVEAQIQAISRMMGDQGFEFRPVRCRSLREISPHLADHVFSDEVDLILVDWDLGGETRGEAAIRQIRDDIPYKDVVFYSANTDAQELRRRAFENGLEGIYCATRDGLIDEVMGVFESLVKKVLDLDHTRGIVMGATSDIDYIVHDSLAALHGLLDDEGKRALVRSAVERISERLRDLTKRVTALSQADVTLERILEAHYIFTANDGLRMLSNLLERDPFKEKHGRYRAAVVTYMRDVVPDRNILGHQVLSPAGRPVAVVGRDGREIRLEEMRELRRRLLDLRREFRGLHATLRS
jgi:hypothetical protein